MSTEINRPKVGITLLVVKGDRILLCRRKGPHGAGEYGTPGGHLELGESFEDCALRELAEECGPAIRVTMPRFLCLTNLRKCMPKHYADVGLVAHWVDGDPETTEPDKCGGWEWHPLDRLPEGTFGAVDNLVIAYRTGQPYFMN